MMKQSKSLAQAEAKQRSPSIPGIGMDSGKFIRPMGGCYRIFPIQCFGDYVAIAPFQRSEITDGGILVPGQAAERPDTGVIVGVGENVGNLQVGQHVKFIPKHQAADLTGEFESYSEAQIAVYKAASVVALLPPIEARQIDAQI